MSSPRQLLGLPLKDPLRLSRIHIQTATPLSRTAILSGPLRGPPRLSPTSTSFSAFSTRPALLNVKSHGNGSSRPKSSAEKAASEREDPYITEPVSLKSFGIGRNTKMFLIAVLCVLGTIETWFWCKAIWTWWKGGEKKEEGD